MHSPVARRQTMIRWRNGPAGEIAEWVVVPETDGVTNRSRELARSSIIGGTTMEHYAGIDVSVESASVCVMDAMGRIVREAKDASEPASLIGWFRALGFELTRI